MPIRAGRIMKKAIQLNPDYIFAYNNRGLAWFGKKEYDKAIEAFTQAIQLNRDYTQMRTTTGALHGPTKRSLTRPLQIIIRPSG